MKVLLRTLGEFDLDEVSKHLLIVGDLTGDCFNCKEIGLEYAKVKVCPKCSTEFRFISTRRTQNAGSKFIWNLRQRRPDLIYLEFSDIKEHKDRELARKIFS